MTDDYALAQRLTPHLLGTLLSVSGDTFNYDAIAAFAASLDSANFAAQHFAGVPRFANDEQLIRHCVQQAKPGGLFLEFGVATGRTLRFIAEEYAGPVYGFDGFNGLPEDWRPGYNAGAFAQAPPETAPNAELVIGYFDNTLPGFMVRHQQPVSFAHIDCDLYSSTKTILHCLKGNLIPGSILIFDEYLNYPGWREHEFKAWAEFVEQQHLTFHYTGCVPSHQQVSLILT
jgi:hypothetical protein